MAEQLVAEYIRRTSRKPFKWGECDCVLWAADLVVAAGHDDPAEAHRGTYSTGFEARRVVMASGGMRGLARRYMADFKTGESRDGVCLAICGVQTLFGVLSEGALFLKGDRSVHSPNEYRIVEGWSLWPKL